MAKRFFYACAGLFLLVAAYSFGARNAGAQGGQIIAATHCLNGGGWVLPMAITSTGDVYRADQNGLNWQHVSNVFSGSPTPEIQESWGQVKARYR